MNKAAPLGESKALQAPLSQSGFASQPESLGGSSSNNGHGPTVLLIDDERQILKTTRLLLERAGFQVLCAADGEAGVRAFQAGADEIQIVVVDMMMPRMTGEEVVHEIYRTHHGTPVILTSGREPSDLLPLLPAGGRFDVLRKPYRIATLVSKICSFLGTNGQGKSSNQEDKQE